MSEYIELKTSENTRVFIRKEDLSVIEEVPQSQRAEGMLRVYSAGYKFVVKETTAEDLLKKLQAKTY